MSSTVKKVAIIGPECTGKSDLSQFLATHFKTKWVPEYAREYLDNLTRPYNQSDLTAIAQGQLQMEDELERTANKVLICDTNLYVIKVWSEYKYGNCAPQILERLKERRYDLYFLTYVDILWEEDPLREHPEAREELYEIYYREMLNQPIPFVEIRGDRNQRRDIAVTAVKNLISD